MDSLNNLNIHPEIKEKVKSWLNEDYDQDTRNEILTLIKNKNENELIDRFFQDLEFGTGGLRGIMGVGSNRMNKYVIWKATQGLANYCLETIKGEIKAVIAYDSRNNSKEFALQTTLVFAGNNIKTYLFESLRPTPMLSFAVRYLKTNTGVVITASHNPPEYNGYKVYWGDGGQIVSPQDINIIKHVQLISRISSIKMLTEKQALEKKLLIYIGEEVDKVYYEKVQSLCPNCDIVKKMANNFKIVYTPIHGSGNIPVRTSLKNIGFTDVNIVKEQELPDGNFPTVKSPNPEEPATMALGIKLAKKLNADILLATDPDSDRVGTAVKDKNNEFQLLNGNQLASILTYYLLSELKSNDKLPKNGFIIKTIVTTDLMKKIADDFNIELVEVLTGFKYIGEQLKIQENLKNANKPYKEYIFGGEESYGLLGGTFVRDKDAVIASTLFAEMAAVLKYKNKTVLDYLDEIYIKYGYFKETLKSLTLKGIDGIEKIKKIMETFRNNPPIEIANLKLLKIGDIKKETLLNLQTNQVELKYHLPVSDVLILFLEDNIKITMRPSGTEPKIKFYFGVHQENITNLSQTKQEIDEKILKVMDKFLQLVNEI